MIMVLFRIMITFFSLCILSISHSLFRFHHSITVTTGLCVCTWNEESNNNQVSVPDNLSNVFRHLFPKFFSQFIAPHSRQILYTPNCIWWITSSILLIFWNYLFFVNNFVGERERWYWHSAVDSSPSVKDDGFTITVSGVSTAILLSSSLLHSDKLMREKERERESRIWIIFFECNEPHDNNDVDDFYHLNTFTCIWFWWSCLRDDLW